MKEKRFIKPRIIKETEQDIVGELISPERLAQLYKGRENFAFWRFVLKLRKNNLSKFCVSRAKFKFSKDPEIRFFQIGQVKKGEAPEIVFLGEGKAPGTTEIYNQFAADTWGFAVLKLKGEE